MTKKYSEGDRIQIVTRKALADDVKSGLYYEHFGGLQGTVQKLYESGEVAIEVENEALDEVVSARHTEIQNAMKDKWLNSLSEEAKGRLTDQERDFQLRYTVLVHEKDLTDATGEAPAPRLTSDELASREEAELAKRKG